MAALTEALAAGDVVVLDGGLATELERRGNDISSVLWSARLLSDDPAEIVAAHVAYFRAGAQVATTASYQATFEGFAAAGVDERETARLLTRSVELARQAIDQASDSTGGGGWVAASVGPYGAMLADGSEYRGDYGLSVEALRRFHRRRLEVLAEAGPDVLAMETVPCMAEAEALLTEADRLGHPAWLSLSCDGVRTRNGELAVEAFAMARDVDAVIALGINCTAPRDVSDLIPLAAQASGKPVVVYPNSGELWEAENRSWSGATGFEAEAVRAWVDAGARLVGGCCRVGPEQIAGVAAALR